MMWVVLAVVNVAVLLVCLAAMSYVALGIDRRVRALERASILAASLNQKHLTRGDRYRSNDGETYSVDRVLNARQGQYLWVNDE